MLQAMAEFMKQRDRIIMGQQCRLIPAGRGEVAGQRGNGLLQALPGARPPGSIVHPRAAALLLAGIRVEIEPGQQFTGLVQHFESQHVVMPAGQLGLAELHAEQLAGGAEHAVNHAGQGEVGLEFLGIQAKPLLLELLGVVGDIPGFQAGWPAKLLGEGLQLGQLALGRRLGRGGQFQQKVFDLSR